MPETKPDRSPSPNRLGVLPWIVLVACLALSGMITVLVRRDVEQEVRSQIAFVASELNIKIEERLQSFELIARGGEGLFNGSDTVTRSDWHDFVAALDPQQVVRGIQGVSYAVVIPAAELDAHEQAVRAEGFPAYSVHPAGPRPVYTPVVFIEPFTDKNLRAFGFDSFSESVRRVAMEQARDTGDPALSSKVTLVQDGAGAAPAAAIFAPVYRHHVPLSTIDERRAAIQGWAGITFRVPDVMSTVLQSWNVGVDRTLDIHLYDATEPTAEELLFDRDSGRSPAAVSSAFEQRNTVSFYGHNWLLVVDRSADAPPISYARMWWTLAGTLAVSLLLFAVLASVRTTRRRAEQIADGLTADLRQRQRELEDSEERWKFALEGSGDGLWDWDIVHDSVYYSPRWKSMLGYAESDIGTSKDALELRVHPDDADRVREHFANVVDGRAPSLSVEFRMRRKDGTFMWILSRGMVIGRDADGRATRLIGTHKDIDDAKKMEAELQRHQLDLQEAQRLAQMGSWYLDVDTGHVDWTPALFELFGLEPATSAPDFAQQEQLFVPASWEALGRAVALATDEHRPYELELEIVRADGSHRTALAKGTPLLAPDDRLIGIHGIAMDITERNETLHRIAHLTDLYRALGECNAAMAHATNAQTLFERICDIIVATAGLSLAWVGVVDEATGRLVPVASAGHGTTYLDGIDISVRDEPTGRGPTGTAVREDRPVWVQHFRDDPRLAPWQERARAFGWASSAALPLHRGGMAIGALTMYSTSEAWFDDDTTGLLVNMADDISFALDAIHAVDTLAESEHRFRSLVEQSIAGVCILDDGRITYANPRFREMLGYGSDDGLAGRPLLAFVSGDDRHVVERLLQPTSDHSERADATFRGIRQDGSTALIGMTTAPAVYRGRSVRIGLAQDVADRKVAEAHIERYAAQLEHTFFQTVALTTTLLEMRDPYTAGHEERVAELAVAIGTELGLPAEQLEGLRVSGYLHDVGKISVPTEILTKPIGLTTIERRLVEQHAQAGYDVLKNVDFPWPVATVALQHHERLDGSGYPQCLEGDAIILEARIVAVADVVESMSTHRPYRPALGIDAALAEIELHAGTKFDREVVAACLRLYREKGYGTEVS